ncbi:hypothetical protein ACFLWZ_08615 [Chloroflexota bacterium]
MNADEFIEAVIARSAPELPRTDRHFLKRYQIVLGSGPFYTKDIPAAINLLAAQQELLGKLDPKETYHVPEAKPPVAISQVVVIHSQNADQCHRIRLGLFQTGLINFAGLVYVNFSPFTGKTINSLPADAFADADYHIEYSIFEEAAGEGKTRPLGTAINPVFFAKDIDPTLVQLYFVAGGRRLPDFPKHMTRPLYQTFLDVDPDSHEAIMEFMNMYRVFLFPMILDPAKLTKYITGTEKTLQMGLIADPDQLKAFWTTGQKRMRDVLTTASQGRWNRVMFPPMFPVCENTMVEWRLISGYFASWLAKVRPPEGIRQALFQFEEADTDKLVAIKRYYGWDSYMWAELVDDIHSGKAALVCLNCGKVISPGRHGGRPKHFCTKEENPECYHDRNAKKAKTHRHRES